MSQKIGTVIVDVQADTQKLVKGMNKAETTMKRTTGNMKKALAGMAAGYLSFQGVNAFTSMIKGSIDAADNLGKLSEKLAISTEALSELQFAAGFADVSIGTLNAAMGAMIRRANNFKRDGGGAAAKAMNTLGISAEFARENFTSTEVTFKILLAKLAEMPEGFEKIAVAQDLFSKSASQVVRLSNMGADELARLGKVGKEVGAVISNDMAKEAAILNDKIMLLNLSMSGVSNKLATNLIPQIGALTDTIIDNKDEIVIFATDIVRAFDFVGTTIALTIVDIQKSTAEARLIIGQIANAVTFGFSDKTIENIKSYKTEIKILAEQEKILTSKLNKTYNSFGTIKTEDSKKEIIELTASMSDFRRISNETGKVSAEALKQISDAEKKAAEEAKVLLELRNKQQRQMVALNDTLTSAIGTDYEQWLNKINSQIVSMAENGANATEIMEVFNASQSQMVTDTAPDMTNDFLDRELSARDEILQRQVDSINLLLMQGKIEEDNAKAREKADKKYEGIGSKDWTAGLKGQAKQIANIGNAFADLAKDQKSWSKLSSEQQKDEKLKNKHLENQIGLWGNVAGAMSSMASEGSAAAQVAQVAQTALAVAQGVTAILTQGGGDPYTAIPRMIAMAAMVASTLGTIGASAGSISGNASAQAQVTQELALNELTNQPMLDRLDQQIELLESIDRNGSAAALQNDLSKVEFDNAYEKWKLEVFQGARLSNVSTGPTFSEQDTTNLNEWEKKLGIDVYTISENNRLIRINQETLKEGNNLAITLSNILETEFYTGPFGQAQAKEFGYGEAGHIAFRAAIDQSFADLQGYVNDWAISTIDTIGELTEASDTLKDSYDAITGTTYYESKRLQEAYKDVEKLSGDLSYGEYIIGQIDVIAKAEEFLTGSRLALLLSKDTKDFVAQMELVAEFSEVTGQAFEDGAEGVLNYIDSIELLSAAMETSRSNIKSFVDSFKTSNQLADDLASSVGVEVVSSYEALNEVFRKLAGDMEGLSDADIDFLNANKALLEASAQASIDAQKEVMNNALEAQRASQTSLNSYLSKLTANINTLDGALKSMSTVIDRLKGAVGGSTYSMDKYYDSMRATLSLSSGTDYKAFTSSLKDTISASGVLFDSNNFSSQYDQQFAQAVATNQFEGMEDNALTQIDYLKQIEENTRGQLAILSAQIGSAADAISNFSATANMPDFSAPIESTVRTTANGALITNGTEEIVNNLYLSLLGRSAEQQGLDYWVNNLLSGKLTPDNIGDTMLSAATNAGWTPENGDDFYARYGFKPFADGGIVTKPTMGLIGEAGYPEAIIPLDGRDAIGIQSMTKQLMSQLKILTDINEQQARRLERIDKRDDRAERTAV